MGITFSSPQIADAHDVFAESSPFSTSYAFDPANTDAFGITATLTYSAEPGDITPVVYLPSNPDEIPLAGFSCDPIPSGSSTVSILCPSLQNSFFNAPGTVGLNFFGSSYLGIYQFSVTTLDTATVTVAESTKYEATAVETVVRRTVQASCPRGTGTGMHPVSTGAVATGSGLMPSGTGIKPSGSGVVLPSGTGVVVPSGSAMRPSGSYIVPSGTGGLPPGSAASSGHISQTGSNRPTGTGAFPPASASNPVITGTERPSGTGSPSQSVTSSAPYPIVTRSQSGSSLDSASAYPSGAGSSSVPLSNPGVSSSGGGSFSASETSLPIVSSSSVTFTLGPVSATALAPLQATSSASVPASQEVSTPNVSATSTVSSPAFTSGSGSPPNQAPSSNLVSGETPTSSRGEEAGSTPTQPSNEAPDTKKTVTMTTETTRYVCPTPVTCNPAEPTLKKRIIGRTIGADPITYSGPNYTLCDTCSQQRTVTVTMTTPETTTVLEPTATGGTMMSVSTSTSIVYVTNDVPGARTESITTLPASCTPSGTGVSITATQSLVIVPPIIVPTID
ncbi:hypothetical protein MMC21_005455 [Puttea exsequens]|nr:hypothetical protein [Puttea exsequens]